MFLEHLLRQLPQKTTIAIIGNGPIESQGEVIDSHEVVIRFNNFVIDGQETHVGTKTTHHCVNGWKDLEVERFPLEAVLISPFTREDDFGRLRKFAKKLKREVVVARYCWPELARSLKPKPSTGFVLLLILNFYGIEASCFGFDGLKLGHYWDPEWRHDHQDEFEQIKTLHSSTCLKFL